LTKHVNATMIFAVKYCCRGGRRLCSMAF